MRSIVGKAAEGRVFFSSFPKRKPKRRGRLHGAAMIAWMFFANLFDPAKVAQTEQLATDRRGDPAPERRAAGAPPRP